MPIKHGLFIIKGRKTVDALRRSGELTLGRCERALRMRKAETKNQKEARRAAKGETDPARL